MLFKDLEEWQNTIKDLKETETVYEYTKDDIIAELEKENQELKRENNILIENSYHNDKVVDNVRWENMLLKNQQKEFIEYLKNWLEILEGQFERMHGVNAAYQKLIIDTVNEVLSKYKEIIGGDRK